LELSRPRDKAFFCMMAQTGLRPETLCNLRIKHIEPEFTKGIIPCKIDVPEEITKGQYRAYFTFMAEESTKYLRSYLATRSNIGPEDYVFASHGTDKQLNSKSISGIFKRVIEQLKEKGLMDFEQKQVGKPRTVRLYNLRKFFRKFANQAGFEFVQFWMGHIVKQGQDEHYRPKDVEFYRKLYAEKAMPFLRFETATPSETDKVIQSQAQKIEDLKKRLNTMKVKNVENFQKLEEKMATMVTQRLEMIESAFRKRYAKALEDLMKEHPKIKEDFIKGLEDFVKEHPEIIKEHRKHQTNKK